ncbi:MAG: ABC transporter permease [Caldiserica bacterium]|nr:ABC transporter permease [Caldisericota bacterium]
MLDLFGIAVRGLLHRKKRSWLTIVGILIGITAVVALVSLGESMQRAVKRSFEELGYDVVMILPGELGGGFGGPGSFSTPFEIDVDALSTVEGVGEIGLLNFQSVYVKAGGKEGFLDALGVSGNIFSFFKVEMVEGRGFTEGERGAAILGREVATELGIGAGGTVLIEDRPFAVVGVYSADSRLDEDAIIIPLADLQELTGTRAVTMVLVRVAPGYDVSETAKRIEDFLRRSRGRRDLSVQTMEEVHEVVQRALGILGAFLGGIAGIALLVGGIGVMNTMYTAVLERTREIGVMKAVGARNSQIALIFLLESGLMGLAGGILGTGIGSSLNFIAVFAAKRALGTGVLEYGISWWLVLGALGFSFLVGAVAGLLPARAAARLDPVEALRYE